MASTGIVVGVGNWPLSVAATLLMGLNFGSTYPTVIALVTSQFKGGPGKAGRVIMATSTLAAMPLPWLQGLLLIEIRAGSSPWFAAAWSSGIQIERTVVLDSSAHRLLYLPTVTPC